MVFNGKAVDPYRLLGVTRESTKPEVLKSYREMAKKYHTDTQVDVTPKYEAAIRLLNEAKDTIFADIEKREEDRKNKMATATDLSGMDLETMKEALKMQIAKYIGMIEPAKMTCDLNADVPFVKKVSSLFGDEIAVARNCMTLVDMAQTEDEAKQVKIIFDKKKDAFNKNFFDSIWGLFQESLLFIYYSFESQFIVSTLVKRDKNKGALEWFMENQDGIISTVRYDMDIRKKLDAILEEFSGNDLVPYVTDEVRKANDDIIEKTNSAFQVSNSTCHHFDGDEFFVEYRKIIEGIFDSYGRKIDSRKSKIKYLVFALNISDDIKKSLENNIHDDAVFTTMVDKLEGGVFNSYLANAAKKELK